MQNPDFTKTKWHWSKASDGSPHSALSEVPENFAVAASGNMVSLSFTVDESKVREIAKRLVEEAAWRGSKETVQE